MHKKPTDMYYILEPTEPTQEILHLIQQSDENQLQQFTTAIMRRYSELFPDWEIMYMALPTAPDTRKQSIEETCQFLRRMYLAE